MMTEKKALIDEIKNNDEKLRLISDPFGGFRNVLDIDDLYFQDQMMPTKVKEQLQVRAFEDNLNQKFNAVSNGMGMKDTKWGRLTILMFAFWSLLTALCCFEKADLLNQTIAVNGLMIMIDPQRIKQSYLRLIVALMPLTYAYDLFWVFHKHSEYANDKSDGGMAQVILALVWF